MFHMKHWFYRYYVTIRRLQSLNKYNEHLPDVTIA